MNQKRPKTTITKFIKSTMTKNTLWEFFFSIQTPQRKDYKAAVGCKHLARLLLNTHMFLPCMVETRTSTGIVCNVTASCGCSSLMHASHTYCLFFWCIIYAWHIVICPKFAVKSGCSPPPPLVLLRITTERVLQKFSSSSSLLFTWRKISSPKWRTPSYLVRTQAYFCTSLKYKLVNGGHLKY